MERRKPVRKQGPNLLEAALADRGMPFSNDAEKGMLSCFLHDPGLLADFAKHLPKEAFYHPANVLLYSTLQTFREKGLPIEYIAISQYLQDKGIIQNIGGPGALAELLDFVPTPTFYGYYRGILRDKHLLRRVILASTENLDAAYSYQEDVPQLLSICDKRITDISKEAAALIKSKTWMDEVSEFEDDWNERYLKKKRSATPSRWGEWNKHFGGLRPEFHIIKGKTSKGKTSLALNLLATIAVEHQRPCLWFPYEMKVHSLICRLIADLGSVDSRCVFSPDVFPPTSDERRRIGDAKDRIASSPIEIVKERNMDAAFIINRCLAFAQSHGDIGLIGIDYLQKIMHPEWSGRNDNTSDRIAYNCGQCFGIQQELQCPMVVISSTNADGGTLGSQSADYDTDIAIEVDKDHGFKVPKNRNGPTARDWIPLRFNGQYVRFESEHNMP